jgi:NAD(P)-dependent dehydrogenase (short-subunit alcohol dehydrogenase family)
MEIFKDRVVIITGGASGIGRALGMALARAGSHVTLADRNEELLLKTAKEITNEGFQADAVPLDVSSRDDVKKLVDDVLKKQGRIDYLFNNAGIVIAGEAQHFAYEDWRTVIDINLYGVVNGVAAAYPAMVKQGFGHIINTASAAGIIPAVGEISYTTSKYGVVGLSNSLRIEGADLGVKVSVVCPGFIDTPILATPKIINFDRGKMMDLYPKMTSPEKCANAILQGVRRNKAIIIVTPLAKIAWFLQRLSPALVRWLALKSIRKMREIRVED